MAVKSVLPWPDLSAMSTAELSAVPLSVQVHYTLNDNYFEDPSQMQFDNFFEIVLREDNSRYARRWKQSRYFCV